MDQSELAQVFNDSYERVMNAPGKSGVLLCVLRSLHGEQSRGGKQVHGFRARTDMHTCVLQICLRLMLRSEVTD